MGSARNAGAARAPIRAEALGERKEASWVREALPGFERGDCAPQRMAALVQGMDASVRKHALQAFRPGSPMRCMVAIWVARKSLVPGLPTPNTHQFRPHDPNEEAHARTACARCEGSSRLNSLRASPASSSCARGSCRGSAARTPSCGELQASCSGSSAGAALHTASSGPREKASVNAVQGRDRSQADSRTSTLARIRSSTLHS